MLLGFFKKMVVADNLAPFVDSVFRNPDPTGGEVILGTVAFAFQIYADFSAYTDIARCRCRRRSRRRSGRRRRRFRG